MSLVMPQMPQDPAAEEARKKCENGNFTLFLDEIGEAGREGEPSFSQDA
jgi:hypothetical protein